MSFHFLGGEGKNEVLNKEEDTVKRRRIRRSVILGITILFRKYGENSEGIGGIYSC